MIIGVKAIVFCGGVNYRDLYKEALERKEKFDSKMTSI